MADDLREGVLMLEMARIDLRGLPIWDRPGAAFAAFDRLTDGEVLTLVTENEPRGLAASLLQGRRNQVMLERRRVGAKEWHVTLRRTESNGEASPRSLLERNPLFCDLDTGALTALAQASTLHSGRRGQTVVPENTDWPYVGVVVEGTLALSSGSASARQRIFYEISEGETFGETEFFDRGLTHGRTVILSKAARFLRIPRDVVYATGMASPGLIAALAHAVAQRSRLLAEALATQATQPILARIASVLIPYAMAERGLTPALTPLPNLTQAQIAATAGTVKEVAARAIAELENRGLLKRERGHIKYLDRARLLELVRELS